MIDLIFDIYWTGLEFNDLDTKSQDKLISMICGNILKFRTAPNNNIYEDMNYGKE